MNNKSDIDLAISRDQFELRIRSYQESLIQNLHLTPDIDSLVDVQLEMQRRKVENQITKAAQAQGLAIARGLNFIDKIVALRMGLRLTATDQVGTPKGSVSFGSQDQTRQKQPEYASLAALLGSLTNTMRGSGTKNCPSYFGANLFFAGQVPELDSNEQNLRFIFRAFASLGLRVELSLIPVVAE